MAICLKQETRQRAIASIRRFFAEHMDDEIGDLKAGLVMDFLLDEVGPCIYNQAIGDAQAYMQEKIVDIDGTCYEPEFGYWTK